MKVDSTPSRRVLAYALLVIPLRWGPVARANFITIDDPGGAATILYGINNTVPYNINNKGQIVGSYFHGSHYHGS
jgi:hypothetical protein